MSPFTFEIVARDKNTKARAGVIKTPSGEVKTPAFSVVGTRAAVRGLSPEDLKEAGCQVVLANTYHLYLRPGVEVIEGFGGFPNFMGWNSPTITDSGGYQVSFLWTQNKDSEDGARVVKISDEGATFLSHIDGTKHLLTPEKSMEIQHILGADIIMAFDQPLGIDYSEKKKKEAFERTYLWEERSFKTWQELEKNRKTGTYQALYGIVQGDTNPEWRKESMKFLLNLEFPGIAIGGESIGKDARITAESLDSLQSFWPEKPVHALGLGGGPEGIFEAVQRGVDTFDNTSITRMARSGLLFIYPEDGGTKENKFRIDITKSKLKNDKLPLSVACDCKTCTNYSKAYIHHLLISKELLGLHLATLHNVTFVNNLMKKIRESIIKGVFLDFKKDWLER